jgi:hypothetical protein
MVLRPLTTRCRRIRVVRTMQIPNVELDIADSKAQSHATTPRALPLRKGVRMSLPSAKILEEEADPTSPPKQNKANEENYELKAQCFFPLLSPDFDAHN